MDYAEESRTASSHLPKQRRRVLAVRAHEPAICLDEVWHQIDHSRRTVLIVEGRASEDNLVGYKAIHWLGEQPTLRKELAEPRVAPGEIVTVLMRLTCWIEGHEKNIKIRANEGLEIHLATAYTDSVRPKRILNTVNNA